MNITLKIKLGKDPEHLLAFEREGELFESLGIRLFLCKPSLTSPRWRVFCAKTGLGFGNLSNTRDEALLSAGIKFRVYGRDKIAELVEEGCKDGGYINEAVLSNIKSLKDTEEKTLE